MINEQFNRGSKAPSDKWKTAGMADKSGRKIPGVHEEKLPLNWKDVLAIILAVYRVFLPWAFALAGIYALLLLAFDWIY